MRFSHSSCCCRQHRENQQNDAMTQIISDAMRQSIEGSSWIRRMFEEGARLKAELGAENVFDFSLGNPILEPPPAFYEALRKLLSDPPPGLHRYIPNAGLPEVRRYVAEELGTATGLPYGEQQVVMTCGAAGVLATTRALLVRASRFQKCAHVPRAPPRIAVQNR